MRLSSDSGMLSFDPGSQYSQYNNTRQPRRSSSRQEKIFKGLLTSIGLYWDAAFLFSFTIVIPAMISDFNQPSAYNRPIAQTSMGLTFSTVTITWPLCRLVCRHAKARGWLLFVLATMELSVTILLMARDRADTRRSPFETICLGLDNEWIEKDEGPLGLTLFAIIIPLRYILVSQLYALVLRYTLGLDLWSALGLTWDSKLVLGG